MRHMYKRCSGNSPSLHRVLVPTLCDEGAVAHDICVQDSVATFTSREEDFLDSTCTKSHTGPPNSSKVAVKIPHHLKSISNLPGLQKKLQTPPQLHQGLFVIPHAHNCHGDTKPICQGLWVLPFLLNLGTWHLNTKGFIAFSTWGKCSWKLHSHTMSCSNVLTCPPGS